MPQLIKTKIRSDILADTSSERRGPHNLFSNKDVFRTKSKASEYLVPFILNLYMMDENKMTQAIMNSVIELDSLAIQIDFLIDTGECKSSSNLTIKEFVGLEEQIRNCFNSLIELPDIERLISYTSECINKSFIFNTNYRSLVYNFDKEVSSLSCTTYYLLPLVEQLTSLSHITVSPKKIFFLISNYIQLLDDFCDLYFDMQSNISTPVTKRFLQVTQECKTDFTLSKPFETLVSEVKIKLNEYLEAIEKEARNITGDEYTDLLFDWYQFHSSIEMIQVPSDNSISRHLDYLQNIKVLTPPILCY